jgi:hypothetical protein
MRYSILFPILLVFLIGGHLFTLNQLSLNREGLINEKEELTPLPAAAIKLLALDYRNLIADLIFSRTMSFYGGKLNRMENVDSQTWEVIYKRLELASELDPYFVDPYFFGQAALTWAAGMAKETNALLERGYQYRTDDWTIPFFIGFNHFYFLHDNAQAAVYLMEASKRPGSSPLVGLLAARLASKGGGIETSIAFLHQLEQQTEDEATRKQIHDRRMALEGIWVLEQAVERYRQQFGERPGDLQILVKKGLLNQLPGDPYGGTFYLNDQGKVWTTSDLRPMRKSG